MENLISYFILIPLLIIVYQDFKERAISWWLIPLLLIIGGFNSYYTNGRQTSMQYFFVNCLFIIFQLLILTIYFSIKEKRLVNIIDRWIGLGDWLFFIGLALLFSPFHFVIFFILSILSTLIVFLILKQTIKRDLKTIPLAGAMSLSYLLIWLVYFRVWNRFYSEELINYFL